MPQHINYIVVVLLAFSGVLLLLSLNNENYVKPEEGSNYIKPTDFSVGPIYEPTYKSSNLCDTTVLKPIIPVNVDYGTTMPENCPCTKYLTPP
jgi:hypothetical protein